MSVETVGSTIYKTVTNSLRRGSSCFVDRGTDRSNGPFWFPIAPTTPWVIWGLKADQLGRLFRVEIWVSSKNLLHLDPSEALISEENHQGSSLYSRNKKVVRAN